MTATASAFAADDLDARRIAQAEHAQARQRVIVTGITVVCMLISVFSVDFDPSRRSIIIALAPVSCLCSVGLLLSIRAWPAPSLVRRILSMAHDFGALTTGMILGGEMFMPACAIIVWITVGYGLRYGLRYLLVSTVLALLSLVLVDAFTAYWQHNPYVAATLLLTVLLIPAYAYRLLVSLREARDAATEANLAKSRFLAHASHDLRQPIHASGLLIACLRETELLPEQRQIVDDIDRSLRRVGDLFRSLLDLSTIDSGGIVPRVEPVAVRELLADIVHRNAEAARWAGVTLRLVSTNAWIATDPQLLATVVQNIVSNAIKYAPGGPVLIGCRRRAATLEIAICDRGPGIAEKHVGRLFEEFYRARSLGDSDVEGMGLGLAIVRRLADLLTLGVAIRSVMGRGTSVMITGMRLVDRPGQLRVGDSDVRDQEVPLDGLRVVLVDDDRVTLAATRVTLQRWGCIVQSFARVPTAIAQCDLLITDFDLGEGTTGIDCVERVRRLAGHDTPAIVVTGHDAATVLEHMGLDDVMILSKPILLSALRVALEAQARRMALRPTIGVLPRQRV